jgi:hypothetical protein
MSRKPPAWLLLVISLPSRSATPRMRIWRALKAAGAAVLRDGVYLLPPGEVMLHVFEAQAREAVRFGGAAQVLRLADLTPGQDQEFRGLFDRTADYARVMDAARKLKPARDRRRHAAAGRTINRLKREYQMIRVIDYFPGASAEQAGQKLAEVEAGFAAPDEPQGHGGRIARLARKDYRGRTWATRARPWVDRLASVWLIKRFIDPRARILWLKNPKDCPRRALGFDFDDAAFTHVGARVTFEVLLASFGLEDDPGLERLGRLVHYLDVGGVPVAEAQGLASILAGARTRYTNDDVLTAEAEKIFDHLYTEYSSKP